MKVNHGKDHLGWAGTVLLTIVALAACQDLATTRTDKQNVGDEDAEMDDYQDALRDAIDRVDIIREFHEVYPDAFGFISYYTGVVRDPIWGSKTFLYGRYTLSLRIPIVLSEDRREIVEVGEPRFLLVEAVRVEDLGGRGRFSVRFGDSWYFGIETWKQLKRVEGRIEKVFTERAPDRPDATIPDDRQPFEGIRVDEPVPLFDAYEQRLRQGRWHLRQGRWQRE